MGPQEIYRRRTSGKTLGIVGLGRIGRVVASRARAMGMLIVAYDPFIAPEQARDLEIELAPLDEVYARLTFSRSILH